MNFLFFRNNFLVSEKSMKSTNGHVFHTLFLYAQTALNSWSNI